MRKHIAAALSIAITMGPAAAVDLGVGVQAGGIGIGASVGVGRTGTSIGIGASTGSLGKVDAGASVGTDKGSIGASVGATSSLGGASIGASGSLGGASIGASGSLGGASGGLSAGTGGGASSASGAASAAPGASPDGAAAASRSKRSTTVAATVRIAPAKGVQQSITLPKILRPSGRADRSSGATSVDEIPGTPRAVVRACREAVESAATPFGVVSVRARSAGSLRRLSRGAISAPVQVRIHYARQGGAEIRQARIRCHLDASGTVIGLT